MGTLKRFLWGFSKFILAAAFGAAITMIAIIFADDPTPKMFADLPTESSAVEAEVKRRFAAVYPVGMPEYQLIEELSALGYRFKRSDNGLFASLFVNSFVCSSTFFVSWTVDANRNLTSIEGGHHIACF